MTDGQDREARLDMSFAALLGGLSLANAGLGAVHGFAAPLGGMFPAPHGAVCAALLPFVMEANLRVLRAREPRNPALERYRTVARALTDDTAATAEDGVRFVSDLRRKLQVPPLSVYGLGKRRCAASGGECGQSEQHEGQSGCTDAGRTGGNPLPGFVGC